MKARQITVRPCEVSDLEPINDLYNHYVATSPATFDIEPMTKEQRREWFSHYAPTGRHRLLVATDGDRVLGFASSSPVRARRAYETSIETTIYVAHDALGRGIGTTLYGALFDALAGEDLHRAYAGITQPNDPSVALHERFGFVRAGTYTEQGRKFGRYWDVAWFEKHL
ncbi:MAG: N-acetyltransferase family protein [Actinobacteria bacterium]|nr:MAG: N-acetyltransferase family protein [Actinomycetota bacterium]